METSSDNAYTRMIQELRKHYDEAIELQAKTEPESAAWWWCEGRKMAAENTLLWAGIDPAKTVGERLEG